MYPLRKRWEIKHNREREIGEHKKRAVKMMRDNVDSEKIMLVDIGEVIGFGVFALDKVDEGEYLLEYHGKLLTAKEGYEEEKSHEKYRRGCFLYFFDFGGKKLSMDATFSSRWGRFVNDSPPTYANSEVRPIAIDGKVRLAIFARKTIHAGTELRYSYNSSFLWWRKNTETLRPYSLASKEVEVYRKHRDYNTDDYLSIGCQHFRVSKCCPTEKIESINGKVLLKESTSEPSTCSVEVFDSESKNKASNPQTVEENDDILTLDSTCDVSNYSVQLSNSEAQIKTLTPQSSNEAAETINKKVLSSESTSGISTTSVEVLDTELKNKSSNPQTVEETDDILMLDSTCDVSSYSVQVSNSVAQIKTLTPPQSPNEAAEAINKKVFSSESTSGISTTSVEVLNTELKNKSSNSQTVEENDDILTLDSTCDVSNDSVQVFNSVAQIKTLTPQSPNEVAETINKKVIFKFSSPRTMIESINGKVLLKESTSEQSTCSVEVFDSESKTKSSSPQNVFPTVLKGQSSKSPGYFCPAAECGEFQTRLPRHVVTAHNWSCPSSEMITSVIHMKRKIGKWRASCTPSKKRKKDYHTKYYLCGKEDCFKIFNRRDQHLGGVHKMKKDGKIVDPTYHEMLKKCMQINPDIFPEIFTMSPMKYLQTSYNSSASTGLNEDNSSFSVTNESETIVVPGVVSRDLGFKNMNDVCHSIKHITNATLETDAQGSTHEAEHQIIPEELDGNHVTEAVSAFEFNGLNRSEVTSVTLETNVQVNTHEPVHQIITEQLHETQETCAASAFQSINTNISGTSAALKQVATVDPNTNANVATLKSSQQSTADIDFHRTKGHMQMHSSVTANNMDEVLEKFKQWLTGISGKYREEKSSIGVKEDVRRVFHAIGGISTTDLFVQEKIEVYLDKYCAEKNFKGRTIRKYLQSLKDFYIFSISKELPNSIAPEIKGNLRDLCHNWSKKYRKKCGKEFWKLQEKHNEILVGPQEIKIYLNSNFAKDAEKIFQDLSQGQNILIDLADYVRCRNHLIISIEIANAHRGAVHANVCTKDVEDVRDVEDMKLIDVEDHKTSPFYGAANITIDEILLLKLQVFIRKVRNIVPTEIDNVFITQNGTPMTSSSISEQINAVWHKVGLIRNDQRMCLNVFRKSVATGLFRSKIGYNKEVAGLMGHSEETQKRHYALRQKEKEAVVGAKTIQKIFFPSTPKKQRLFSEEDNQQFEESFLEQNKFSMADVRNAIENNDLELSKPVTPKQIYDHVLYMRKTSPKRTSLDMGKENEFPVTVVRDGDIPLIKNVTSKHADNENMCLENGLSSPSTIKYRQSGIVRLSTFSEEELDILIRYCRHEITTTGRFDKRRIKNRLSHTKIMTRHEYEVVKRRLQYERRRFVDKKLVYC